MFEDKKIGLVEDDPQIRETVAGFVNSFGCQLVFQCDSFDSGVLKVNETKPDLALLDIRLGADKTGIMLGSYIRKHLPSAAIIFITSLTDSETLAMASINEPEGYLVKPFEAEDLRVAIQLAFLKKNPACNAGSAKSQEFFVKNGHQHEKLNANDIVFLQAEGNYVKIKLLSGKSLLIRSSLKDFTEQLPAKQFMQIHKSWVVNLSLIKSVSASQVIAVSETLPLSPAFRNELLNELGISL